MMSVHYRGESMAFDRTAGGFDRTAGDHRLILVGTFASCAGSPATSSRMKTARNARASRTNSETTLQTGGRIGEIDAQNMDQCGIGPGACATGRPSLGAAAHSNHCGRL